MKIIITICGLIWCVHTLPLAQSHYLYADNPNTGYVSLNNGGDNFPIGFNGKQRRYLAYPNAQIYQKSTDSGSTKITKTPSEPAENKNNKSTPKQQPTEKPKKQQNKEEINYIHDSRNVKGSRARTGQNQIHSQATKAVGNARGKEYAQSNQKNFNGKVNTYDNKGNIVQVNVHKTQIPAEPQKVKLNANRQLTALSVQRREDNYKKIPTSVLVDKTLQKSANFKERNAQIMSRVLDDMTKKVSDRRIKNNEYRKRDTQKTNAKRNIVSDTMKKYIGKDITISKDHQPRDARIGSREEEIEDTNAPYALFYRMSPQTLDNREGFYLMKSMEEEGETYFSNKEKRLTVNYQNAVDLKKAKTKKNFNTIRLRKKVKNFSNFRSNPV